MQLLAGSWVRSFQFRREGMSCFSEVWKFVHVLATPACRAGPYAGRQISLHEDFSPPNLPHGVILICFRDELGAGRRACEFFQMGVAVFARNPGEPTAERVCKYFWSHATQRSPRGCETWASLPPQMKRPLTSRFVNTSNGFGVKELTWSGLQTQSVDVNFCSKYVVTFHQFQSCCVLEIVKNLHGKRLLSQELFFLPPWVGTCQTLRTLEALTLTVHASCVLITSPSTKTGQRKRETQSVITEDGVLVPIINRLLYVIGRA